MQNPYRGLHFLHGAFNQSLDSVNDDKNKIVWYKRVTNGFGEDLHRSCNCLHFVNMNAFNSCQEYVCTCVAPIQIVIQETYICENKI